MANVNEAPVKRTIAPKMSSKSRTDPYCMDVEATANTATVPIIAYAAAGTWASISQGEKSDVVELETRAGTSKPKERALKAPPIGELFQGLSMTTPKANCAKQASGVIPNSPNAGPEALRIEATVNNLEVAKKTKVARQIAEAGPSAAALTIDGTSKPAT